jgi:hypothetical protein
MATYNKFNSFTEALAEKVHNLASDTLTVALCASANAPVATNTQLSNLTQITYTNLSSRVLTQGTSSQTSGTYKLTINDLTLPCAGTACYIFVSETIRQLKLLFPPLTSFSRFVSQSNA